MTTGLTIGGLESAYDQLATAIDTVGEDKSELFLPLHYRVIPPSPVHERLR